MDDVTSDLTSTNDNSSSQTISSSVIVNDQSSENLNNPAYSASANEPPIFPVQPDEAELEANSSEPVDSGSPENTRALPDEAPSSGEDVNAAKETIAPETLPSDTASCDENVDATSSADRLADDEKCSSDATNSTTSSSDILNKNKPIDSANEMNDRLSDHSNCADFDKSSYSADFVEDLPKIEKNNSLIASDLISSETMNDFFDEMYEMNYANHYRNKKDDGGDNLAQNYCADEVDGNPKDQDWDTPAAESDSCPADESTNSSTIQSSLKRVGEMEPSKEYLPCKKARKGITFDSVSVYYFPRTQGFTCIPSQGGSTLGMSWNHTHIRKFSLGEHATEQRKAHRQLCSQQLDSTTNWSELSNVSSDDSDSDEVLSDSEVDYENYNFLQPIPTRERRAMLRAAGIHKIDSREKDECRNIRLSREFCGCTCQIYCDPERCVCAQAGIKCQVDRMNFPCSCTRDGCANENGRIEFNPMRVRTHFIHTLMRLEMEKKKEEEEEHNHRLLFGDLDNVPQLPSYPLPSTLAQSSSAATSNANLLTSFTYHPDSLPYYAQPPSQQPSLYDVPPVSTAALEGAQLPHPAFGYEGHQFAMAAAPADDSAYSQLSSVSSLTVLGENGTSLAAGYAMSGEQCLRLAAGNYDNIGALTDLQQQHQPVGFDVSASAAIRATAAYDGAEPFARFAAEDEAAKERNLEFQSEGEALDTSAEMGEETEKEEESDLENFGDIIKKTMVESVIA